MGADTVAVTEEAMEVRNLILTTKIFQVFNFNYTFLGGY